MVDATLVRTVPYDRMPSVIVGDGVNNLNFLVADPLAPQTIRFPQPTPENNVVRACVPGLSLAQVQDACLGMGIRMNALRTRILMRFPRATINTHDTGSVVCTGAKSPERAIATLNELLIILRRHRSDQFQPSNVRAALALQRTVRQFLEPPAALPPPPSPVDPAEPAPITELRFADVALNNIVACVRTGLVTDLEIMKRHVVTGGDYEPDNFPGLIEHVWVERVGGKGKMAILYFPSGAFNITGAQNLQEVWFLSFMGCLNCWEAYKIAQRMNSAARQLSILQFNGVIAHDVTVRSAIDSVADQLSAMEGVNVGGAVANPVDVLARGTPQLRRNCAQWIQDTDPYLVASNLRDLQERFSRLTASLSASSSPTSSQHPSPWPSPSPSRSPIRAVGPAAVAASSSSSPTLMQSGRGTSSSSVSPASSRSTGGSVIPLLRPSSSSPTPPVKRGIEPAQLTSPNNKRTTATAKSAPSATLSRSMGDLGVPRR